MQNDTDDGGCSPVQAETGRHDDHEPGEQRRHHPLHHLVHLLLLVAGSNRTIGGDARLEPHRGEDDPHQ